MGVYCEIGVYKVSLLDECESFKVQESPIMKTEVFLKLPTRIVC